MVGASQDFLVKTLGGSSSVRDCYRTAFYVGGDRRSAAALLDIPERQIDDGPLGAGVAMLRNIATGPARMVRVPLASNAGVALLMGECYHGNTLPRSNAEAMPEATTIRAAPPLSDAEQLRLQRIRAAVEAQRSQSDILREVWGVNATRGREFETAVAEYRRLLAILVGGGEA